MMMNKFRLYQDPSSNAIPETLKTTNSRIIDCVVRELNEKLFPKMVQTKSSIGLVGPDAIEDTGNDEAIVVDDENDGGEVLRRSSRKRPENDVFDPSKITLSPRPKPKKRRNTGKTSSSANNKIGTPLHGLRQFLSMCAPKSLAIPMKTFSSIHFLKTSLTIYGRVMKKLSVIWCLFLSSPVCTCFRMRV